MIDVFPFLALRSEGRVGPGDLSLGFPTVLQPVTIAREGTAENKDPERFRFVVFPTLFPAHRVEGRHHPNPHYLSPGLC